MAHQKISLKKTRQRAHAKKRALQRYGLVFTTKDLKKIVSLIRQKPKRNAVKLAVPTSRISLWKVIYNGIELPVAYDWKSQTIASILPQRALEKYKGETE